MALWQLQHIPRRISKAVDATNGQLEASSLEVHGRNTCLWALECFSSDCTLHSLVARSHYRSLWALFGQSSQITE